MKKFSVLFPVVAALMLAACDTNPSATIEPADIEYAVTAVSGTEVAAVSIDGVSVGSVALPYRSSRVSEGGEFRIDADGGAGQIGVMVAVDGRVLLHRIATRLSLSGSASLGGLEVEGPIEALSDADITVAGLTFLVTATTRVEDRDGQHIEFSTLTAGEWVEVEGMSDAAGTLSALKVELEAQDSSPEIEIDGTIDDLGPDYLLVSGVTLRVDDQTRIEGDGRGLALSDLKIGDMVEVEGDVLADGTFLATRIEREQDSDSNGDADSDGDSDGDDDADSDGDSDGDDDADSDGDSDGDDDADSDGDSDGDDDADSDGDSDGDDDADSDGDSDGDDTNNS